MVSKYYKISHKPLRKNSFKSFQSCLYMYSLFSNLLTYLKEKIRTFVNISLQGEKSFSAKMEIISTELLLPERMK